MMGLKKAVPVLAAAVILASAVVAAGEEIQVRYKFNEGDVLKIKTSSKDAPKMMGMESIRVVTRFLEWKVTKVEEGVATIEMKITRIKAKINQPTLGELKYDTDEDEPPPLPQLGLHKYLVKKPFTVRIDDLGKVVEVKGFSKIGDKVIEKFKETMGSNPQEAMALMVMKKELSDEGLKEQLGKGGVELPKEPVKVGSEWKEDTAVGIPVLGGVDITLTIKVESIEGDVLKGKSEGALEEKEGEGVVIGMIKVTEAKVTQEFEFDIKAGQMKKSRRKSVFKAETPMGEVVIKSETTMELMEIKPAGSEEESGSEK